MTSLDKDIREKLKETNKTQEKYTFINTAITKIIKYCSNNYNYPKIYTNVYDYRLPEEKNKKDTIAFIIFRKGLIRQDILIVNTKDQETDETLTKYTYNEEDEHKKDTEKNKKKMIIYQNFQYIEKNLNYTNVGDCILYKDIANIEKNMFQVTLTQNTLRGTFTIDPKKL